MEMSIPGSGLPSASKIDKQVAEATASYKLMTPKQLGKKTEATGRCHVSACENLEFEQAARIRDEIKALEEQMLV